MRISIVDIAEKASVSPTTVSRALNGTGYVSKETKDRILEIANECGYRPQKYKKRRALSSGNTIAVVIPDIANPFFAEIIHGIESITYKKGYDLFICNTEETPSREMRCLASLINHNIRGVIIAIASETSQYNLEYLQHLNANKIPIVLVDRTMRSTSIDSVTIDNYGGASSAVQTLVDNGHKSIAILSGSTTTSTGLDRLNGYIDVLKRNNLPIQEELILYGDFKAESGYLLTKKLFNQGKRVSAIFAANNQMAIGCLRALSELHIEVPGDLSLIVFGAIDDSSSLTNPISQLVPPVASLGEESARILLSKLEKGQKYRKDPSKQIVFPVECHLFGSEVFPTNLKK